MVETVCEIGANLHLRVTYLDRAEIRFMHLSGAKVLRLLRRLGTVLDQKCSRNSVFRAKALDYKR